MTRMADFTKVIETEFPPSVTKVLAPIIYIVFPFPFFCSQLLSSHETLPLHILLQSLKQWPTNTYLDVLKSLFSAMNPEAPSQSSFTVG